MSTHSRRRPAAVLLAGLVPALVAGLAPARLHANARGLRAITIPVSACWLGPGLSSDPMYPLGFGGGVVVRSTASSAILLNLFCPLPVNLDVSGTGNDNDISKFRVHYRDSDGFGPNASVNVRLLRVRTFTGPERPTGAEEFGFTWTEVCAFRSDVHGTSATTGATATRPCVHDVSPNVFYHFHVAIRVEQSTSPGLYSASFLGIDFPP